MKKNNIKVAMLGPLPPTIGGITTMVQNILNSSLASKVQFIPVQTMSRKHGTGDYEQESILSKLRQVVQDMLHLIYVLIFRSVDLVHIHTSLNRWAFHRDAAYLLVSRMFRKKVFLHIHGGELNLFLKERSHFYRNCIIRILKKPDRIAVLSELQQKPFIENGFTREVRIFPNMVDLASMEQQGNFREMFGISEESVVILFIASHFTREKGIWELLRCVPPVIKKNNKVVFVFAGDGSEQYAMERFCSENHCEKNVRFTGFLVRDRIVQLLHAADIFVLPSFSEGFPLVILEAMCAALPVIATHTGAVPEVIISGENGFLVKPGDEADLANKIETLIDDRSMRKKMGRKNLDKVMENYDIPVVAAKFEMEYCELIFGNERG